MIEIRASMLPAWADCPRREAAKKYRGDILEAGYTLRESKPSAGAAIGTAIHAGAAELLRIRKAGATILNIDHVQAAQDVSWESFKKQVERGCEWDATTPEHGAAAHQILRMLQAMVPELTRRLPDLIEQEIKAPIPGYPAELIGHLDLFETTGMLWDHKSGFREPSPWAQLGGYDLLLISAGYAPRGAGIIYIPRRRVSTPQPEIVRREFDREQCRAAAWREIEDICRQMAEFQETGECWAFPANPMSQLCTPKYCPAWGSDFCALGKVIKED